MKTIKDLKQMMSEPSSKAWFSKHGAPKQKALAKAKEPAKDSGHYYSPNGVRYLSKAEQAAKMKSWPNATHKSSAGFPESDKEKNDYQKRSRKAWND